MAELSFNPEDLALEFLPQDYRIPDSPLKGSFMKLVKGNNTFRILTSATTGWEYWIENDNGGKKPIRVKTAEEIPAQHKSINAPTSMRAKHFWLFGVWNYDTKQMELLELTQATIMNQLMSYLHNPVWGKLSDYDITVVKSGAGKETKYSVQPSPKTEITEQMKSALAEFDFKREAFFSGAEKEGKGE